MWLTAPTRPSPNWSRNILTWCIPAALRQVNGDMPAAQDVTQAVFTDLARKAPALTRHTSLTGWLYTSTRYSAAKARRAEHRRRTHEQEAHAMNLLLQSAQSDPAWLELRPLLDEVMMNQRRRPRGGPVALLRAPAPGANRRKTGPVGKHRPQKSGPRH